MKYQALISNWWWQKRDTIQYRTSWLSRRHQRQRWATVVGLQHQLSQHRQHIFQTQAHTQEDLDISRWEHLKWDWWRSSLPDIRAYGGADVGSDHNLVIGKIHWKLTKTTKPEVKKTYATEKLKELKASKNFRIESRNRFAALEHSTDLEEQWQMFVSGVTDSAAKILGKRRGTNKERWISLRRGTW